MRKGLTLLETLIVIAILGTLIALLLPAIMMARESAALMKSQNNLRQIALGLQNLAAMNDGNLPGSCYSDGSYQTDTLVALLPYVDQEAYYRRLLDHPEDWLPSDSDQMPVSLYVNPLDPSMATPNPSIGDVVTDPSLLSVTSYALNAQLFFDSPHMNRMTDGTSQTIWLAEHYGGNCNQTTFIYTLGNSNRWRPYQAPTFAQAGPAVGYGVNNVGRGDYYPITQGNPSVSTAAGGLTFQVRPTINECDPRLPNASSARGLQVAMGDGSVHLLSPSISPQVFWGMVTPNGGEVISGE